MTVYRCYVEKRPEYAVEAGGVASTLSTVIRSGNVKQVRILNRYDLEGIEEADYEKACSGILSEPQVDTLYHETAPAPDTDEWVLAVEYLPGQFDQRADSAAQCIQLMTCKTRPDVRTARIYYIKGALTEEEKLRVRETLNDPHGISGAGSASGSGRLYRYECRAASGTAFLHGACHGLCGYRISAQLFPR